MNNNSRVNITRSIKPMKMRCMLDIFGAHDVTLKRKGKLHILITCLWTSNEIKKDY
ncbi:hypothetical protein Pint_24511 [Pistacia integerrima]|uniref:Uncharacterized protein n=1 Tax=Pistacia integerrima TaxID=434235 RepID=A0ACC0YJ86_9ROSI|nr:hypothetical protein Pint_24511 [Pistacia integerrima]